MIAEQPSLNQYERPVYHVKGNKKILSSFDSKFMIFLFDFERFRIESQFPFLTHILEYMLHVHFRVKNNNQTLESFMDQQFRHWQTVKSTVV